MRYLIALLCPPLAVLLCGKPFQAILSFFLTMCFYFPGALHALLVVSSRLADNRSNREIAAARSSSRDVVRAINRQTAILTTAVIAAPILARNVAGPKPRSIPGPQAAPTTQPAIPATPKKPWLTVAEIRSAAISTKDEAIRAYRNLPDWAQPISWGLAAGSALSIALMIFLVMRGG